MGLVYNNAATSGTIGTTDAAGIMNGTYANGYISNYSIGAMIEGEDEAQLVGHKIRLKHMDFCFVGRQQPNTHQAITLHFELVHWKLYSSSTCGTPPNIATLCDNDSNNWVSTNSY